MSNGGVDRISDYDYGDSADCLGELSDLDSTIVRDIGAQVDRRYHTLPPADRDKIKKYEIVRKSQLGKPSARGKTSGVFNALYAQSVFAGVGSSDVENPRVLCERELSRNLIWKRLPLDLQFVIKGAIVDYMSKNTLPTQKQVDNFLLSIDEVKDYFSKRLNEVLSAIDIYNDLPDFLRDRIYSGMYDYFLTVPLSVDLAREYIEFHPLVIRYCDSIINDEKFVLDEGFEREEKPTKDEMFAPMEIPTSPFRRNPLLDQEVGIEIDDDGNYRSR